MQTLIHCTECYEDVNLADWQANRCLCPHCGASQKRMNRKIDRKIVPLVNLRRRLELDLLLGKESVYAA